MTGAVPFVPPKTSVHDAQLKQVWKILAEINSHLIRLRQSVTHVEDQNDRANDLLSMVASDGHSPLSPVWVQLVIPADN